MINDSTAPWIYSDAYYEAYQDTEEVERDLMGYDQHAKTAYVPYNDHEKEFHYYVGATAEQAYVFTENGQLALCNCEYAHRGAPQGRYTHSNWDIYHQTRSIGQDEFEALFNAPTVTA